MNIGKILIVYTGLVASIALGGCKKKELEKVDSIEIIDGIVLKEKYTEVEKVVGIFGKRKVKDLLEDQYMMIVETNDKRKFCYIFSGAEGRKMDFIYDVNSIVKKFPTKSLGWYNSQEVRNSITEAREKTGIQNVGVKKIN